MTPRPVAGEREDHDPVAAGRTAGLLGVRGGRRLAVRAGRPHPDQVQPPVHGTVEKNRRPPRRRRPRASAPAASSAARQPRQSQRLDVHRGPRRLRTGASAPLPRSARGSCRGPACPRGAPVHPATLPRSALPAAATLTPSTSAVSRADQPRTSPAPGRLAVALARAGSRRPTRARWSPALLCPRAPASAGLQQHVGIRLEAPSDRRRRQRVAPWIIAGTRWSRSGSTTTTERRPRLEQRDARARPAARLLERIVRVVEQPEHPVAVRVQPTTERRGQPDESPARRRPQPPRRAPCRGTALRASARAAELRPRRARERPGPAPSAIRRIRPARQDLPQLLRADAGHHPGPELERSSPPTSSAALGGM